MSLVLAALALVVGCVLIYWAVKGTGPSFLASVASGSSGSGSGSSGTSPTAAQLQAATNKIKAAALAKGGTIPAPGVRVTAG